MTEFIWKWLVCSWAHNRSRCYPTVWGAETAKELGIPYRPESWHCTYCHPCGEELEEMFGDQEERQAKWRQDNPVAAIVENHLLGVVNVHTRLKLTKDIQDYVGNLAPKDESCQ